MVDSVPCPKERDLHDAHNCPAFCNCGMGKSLWHGMCPALADACYVCVCHAEVLVHIAALPHLASLQLSAFDTSHLGDLPSLHGLSALTRLCLKHVNSTRFVLHCHPLCSFCTILFFVLASSAGKTLSSSFCRFDNEQAISPSPCACLYAYKLPFLTC